MVVVEIRLEIMPSFTQKKRQEQAKVKKETHREWGRHADKAVLIQENHLASALRSN